MHEITISRPAQVGLVLTLLAALTAVVVAQLPEIERYLRIRSM
jgi:hypothetical protein